MIRWSLSDYFPCPFHIPGCFGGSERFENPAKQAFSEPRGGLLIIRLSVRVRREALNAGVLGYSKFLGVSHFLMMTRHYWESIDTDRDDSVLSITAIWADVASMVHLHQRVSLNYPNKRTITRG